jgi:uncharacterized protein YhbP (UPF0306 family)
MLLHLKEREDIHQSEKVLNNMSVMNEIIFRFIKQQTCATICCTDEKGIPYCFSCYYVIKPESGLLYFKSSDNAYHTSLLANNLAVAGTILPDKLSKLITKCIQWRGELLEEHHPQTKDADEIYHKKIPLALVIKGKVFTIRLNIIKMTDSQLGFGKKNIWKRDEQ